MTVKNKPNYFFGFGLEVHPHAMSSKVLSNCYIYKYIWFCILINNNLDFFKKKY